MTPEPTDYLWDRTGPPDPHVAALEQALAPLRHRGAPLRPLGPRRTRAGRVAAVLIPALTAAATLMLVAYAGWFALVTGEPGSWQIAATAGAPRINDEAIEGQTRWRVGDRLQTDARSEAEVAVGLIGQVEVRPNSRLTMVRARTAEHRLALEQGSIRATIWAPPGLFFVETPSALAVDLGCAYTLDVAEDGSGLLRVEHGWVGFEYRGREAFIPAGAMCATRPGLGPGTPYFEDAPRELIAALLALDFAGLQGGARAAALDAAFAHARPRDAFSLWHLLTRLPHHERVGVYDRLEQLAPPPTSVTREGILHGDRRMLDAWWDSLGLDTATWWRIWRRRWR